MTPRRLLNHGNRVLLGVACVSLLAIVAVVVAVVLRIQDQNKVERLTRETHTSLCALKLDLQHREDQTQLFLDEIARGERQPIVGISEADLERSLANTRATLFALTTLQCKEGATP